jgi:hypothetical protein
MRTVSFKLSDDVERRLTRLAQARGVSRSALLREALERYANSSNGSFVELAGDLVGCLEGPGDLSTNAEHLSDYGR